MTSLPIRVTCDCGVVTEAVAGEVVTCTCGRRYDTATMVDRAAIARVAQATRRARLLTRLGLLATVAGALLGYAVFGLYGAIIAGAVVPAIWIRTARPIWRRDLKAAVDDVGSQRIGHLDDES